VAQLCAVRERPHPVTAWRRVGMGLQVLVSRWPGGSAPGCSRSRSRRSQRRVFAWRRPLAAGLGSVLFFAEPSVSAAESWAAMVQPLIAAAPQSDESESVMFWGTAMAGVSQHRRHRARSHLRIRTLLVVPSALIVGSRRMVDLPERSPPAREPCMPAFRRPE